MKYVSVTGTNTRKHDFMPFANICRAIDYVYEDVAREEKKLSSHGYNVSKIDNDGGLFIKLLTDFNGPCITWEIMLENAFTEGGV